jgi:hypothetical protein
MSSDLPPDADPFSSSPDGDDDKGEGNKPNQAIRARVPDHIGDGCFSTGAIVVTGPSEFVVDFLQTIGRPHKVIKRVVIPHQVMPQFIEALRTNLELYKSRFGELPTPPTPPSGAEKPRKQTPQEIYDDFKMSDDQLSGVYANGVMIGHGASEFGLDFLTSFFPQSAVSARVFLAAGQVSRLLDSLRGAVHQLEQRKRGLPPGSIGGSPSPIDELGDRGFGNDDHQMPNELDNNKANDDTENAPDDDYGSGDEPDPPESTRD